MNYYFIYELLIPLLISIFIIIILYSQNKKKKELVDKLETEKNKLEKLKKEEIKEYFKEEWRQEENNLKDKLKVKTDGLETEWQLKFQQHQSQLNTLDNEIKSYQSILKEKEKRYNEVNQDLEVYRQAKIEEINNSAELYLKNKNQIIDQSINDYRDLKMIQANNQLEQKQQLAEELKSQIEIIKSELEVERNKRAAINEEIRRARELEEQQDFYKIQIPLEDLNDIKILRSVTSRLRHPEAINKVIWSGYYQKPLAELRKRVAVEGPGVYKITRLKTKEIYIGQAVNVSTRWTDHVKTALGVGTLASSQLHRAMAEDGPEQYTFELLEKVPKDKLRERESYYIDFYDSKTYGLNSVTGDKNK